MSRSTRIILVFIALFGVFLCGVLAGRYTEENSPAQTVQKLVQKMETSESGTPFKFINPLLFCNDQTLSNEGSNTLGDTIQDYITSEKTKGDITEASFYFRDLNGGPWAIVNPDFKTLPASLLKVPLAMSVYERVEKNPDFLNTKITFDGGANPNLGEHFRPQEQIQPHTTYTVDELINYMLKDSDNSAMYLLGNKLSDQELEDSYTRLGIDPATIAGYSIDVKTYAAFFRVLYNATYLNQNNSEHLLSILSQSTFTQGIVAGLPQGMLVAHKFGESNPGTGTVGLNDCGVVYNPKQPYILCVMTRGTNFDTLANVISQISKKTYQILQGDVSE